MFLFGLMSLLGNIGGNGHFVDPYCYGDVLDLTEFDFFQFFCLGPCIGSGLGSIGRWRWESHGVGHLIHLKGGFSWWSSLLLDLHCEAKAGLG